MEGKDEDGRGGDWRWRRRTEGEEDGGGLKVSVVLPIRISEGKRGIKRTGMKIRGERTEWVQHTQSTVIDAMKRTLFTLAVSQVLSL